MRTELKDMNTSGAIYNSLPHTSRILFLILPVDDLAHKGLREPRATQPVSRTGNPARRLKRKSAPSLVPAAGSGNRLVQTKGEPWLAADRDAPYRGFATRGA